MTLTSLILLESYENKTIDESIDFVYEYQHLYSAVDKHWSYEWNDLR